MPLRYDNDRVCHLSCQIANMADAAIARREARRRKILENSHNRLQRISGKNSSELNDETPITAPLPEPNYENSVPRESSSSNKCFLNNGVINTGVDPFGIMSTNLANLAIGDGDVNLPNNDLPSFTYPTPDLPQPSTHTLEKFINSKYDIVLLSIFIQLFHSFSVTFESTYLFLPLLIYCVTKSVLYPKQQSSDIANIILLLNGVSNSIYGKILSIMQWTSAFSQDVCVFLFTTVCMQSLWQALIDILG